MPLGPAPVEPAKAEVVPAGLTIVTALLSAANSASSIVLATPGVTEGAV